MTNTQTHTTKPQIIAVHNTTHRYAIAILQPTPKSLYQVVRFNPESRYIVLNSAKTESEARKIANKIWLRDMGREPAMIECSPTGSYGAAC